MTRNENSLDYSTREGNEVISGNSGAEGGIKEASDGFPDGLYLEDIAAVGNGVYLLGTPSIGHGLHPGHQGEPSGGLRQPPALHNHL